jgi:hypothetical protein
MRVNNYFYNRQGVGPLQWPEWHLRRPEPEAEGP